MMLMLPGVHDAAAPPGGDSQGGPGAGPGLGPGPVDPPEPAQLPQRCGVSVCCTWAALTCSSHP